MTAEKLSTKTDNWAWSTNNMAKFDLGGIDDEQVRADVEHHLLKAAGELFVVTSILKKAGA